MRNRLTFHSNILLSVSRHGWCSGSFYNWNEWPRKWRSLTCANMTLSSSKCRPAWPVRLLTLADAITQQLLRFPLPHLLVAFISHFFKKIASFFPVFLPNLFFSLLSSSLYFRRKVQDNRLTIALKKMSKKNRQLLVVDVTWRTIVNHADSAHQSQVSFPIKSLKLVSITILELTSGSEFDPRTVKSVTRTREYIHLTVVLLSTCYL